MKLTDEILKEFVLKTLKEAKQTKSKPIANVKTSSASEKGTQGSDSKGAKVLVKPSSKKSAKQAKPNFKEKTTSPKASTGDPFDELAKEGAGKKLDKAPKMDAKVSITGTKSVDKKTGANTGKFSKKAPAEKKDKPIAKPAFTMKESYSKKDLVKFIYEQAKKSIK